MKKRMIALVMATVLSVLLLSQSVLANENESIATSAEQEANFNDVKSSDWYYGAVNYVFDKQIMTGLNSTRFGASENLARAQFATILYRMEGSPTVKFTKKFPDVSDGNFYSDAVIWANENKIVTGYTNGKFGPADNITREQIGVMMYRYAKYKDYNVTESKSLGEFPDNKNVSDFAADSIEWAVASGLISGTQGNLAPQGLASRAECATIIMRFLKSRPVEPETPTENESYFFENSEVVRIAEVADSKTMFSEEEVCRFLEDKGFDSNTVTYEYSISGEYTDEMEASDSSTAHPMYQTSYIAKTGDVWTIYVIEGTIMAYPASFNLNSDLDAEVIFSETDKIISYDDTSNKFYITIPKDKGAIVKTVKKITAETLDQLGREEILNFE